MRFLKKKKVIFKTLELMYIVETQSYSTECQLAQCPWLDSMLLFHTIPE